MKVNHVFISINAADFAAQSDWWARLIGRRRDRAPMPSCHEWDLTEHVLFQVLDSAEGRGRATVTMHVADLDAEIARLAKVGIDLPDPVKIEGFDTLRYAEFTDPEGNTVGLLDGA
ncbi:glyoxalase [Pelagivirga sediminicola]|uniref:Glyoxalase n=1 Tax=Pelagivirga sediminicola TaxID=2170575 RepID=A0A2T7G9F8_9RHOB|nr:VOC family protein [Pelagivirga sediminicola]PVA11051.1 glyoxalase [Pelagivirga sediminicola]